MNKYFGKYYTQKEGGGGAVMAYEPSPSNYLLLQKNISLNNALNIHSFQFAVAAKKQRLFLDESDLGNSGASHIAVKGTEINAGPISVSDITTVGHFDDIYIKIDTEGYELSVLKGCRELFEAKLIRQIVIEIDNFKLKRFGSSSIEIYTFMKEQGFSPQIGQNDGHYDEVFVKK